MLAGAENQRWVQSLDERHRSDTLVLAGDVCDELDLLAETLGALRERFAQVFYCLGNHEVWLRERDRCARPPGARPAPAPATGAGAARQPCPAQRCLWPTDTHVWCRKAGVADSLAKMVRALELCQELGIHTTPQRQGNLWIGAPPGGARPGPPAAPGAVLVTSNCAPNKHPAPPHSARPPRRPTAVPIYSWHHKSFDREPDIEGVPAASRMTIADYAACRWPAQVPGALRDRCRRPSRGEVLCVRACRPTRCRCCRMPGGHVSGSLELAEWFDRLNDEDTWRAVLASRAECDVISFSHFLPHQALLPEKRFLFYPVRQGMPTAPRAVAGRHRWRTPHVGRQAAWPQPGGAGWVPLLPACRRPTPQAQRPACRHPLPFCRT